MVGIFGMPATGAHKPVGPPYLKHMIPAYFPAVIPVLKLRQRYFFLDCHFIFSRDLDFIMPYVL
jgi:hypothetical protein